ncbi:hypothetical protein BH11BAC5_BH11BAC5_20750 [soil metagenome]|jgi:hypothetical protein
MQIISGLFYLGNYYKFSIIKNNVITANKLHILHPAVKNNYHKCALSSIESMEESM